MTPDGCLTPRCIGLHSGGEGRCEGQIVLRSGTGDEGAEYLCGSCRMPYNASALLLVAMRLQDEREQALDTVANDRARMLFAQGLIRGYIERLRGSATLALPHAGAELREALEEFLAVTASDQIPDPLRHPSERATHANER